MIGRASKGRTMMLKRMYESSQARWRGPHCVGAELDASKAVVVVKSEKKRTRLRNKA